MTERIRVASVSDLEPGERLLIDRDGQSIGVFNVDGEYHALQNTCAHQYGPVCEGDIERKLVGDHGGSGDRIDVRYTDDEYILVCPWHSWTYDLETGRHTGDRDIGIPKFDVVVEDGTVYLAPEGGSQGNP
jgi:nitrite reductase/ring-hydroxylating ferredoxin subunit